MPSKFVHTRIASFGYALKGITVFYKTQPNARIQFFAAILAIGLGWWLKISAVEWTLIMLCIAMVLAGELLNTAIEVLADAVDKNPNPQIGMAKDLAAGAVLVMAIGAAVVGVFIFIPKIIALC